MNLQRVFLLGLSASLATAPLGLALSGRALNPIYHVQAASVELTIGGPLQLDSSPPALSLFADDTGRRDRLEVRLRELIDRRLRATGVSPNSKAKHALLLSLFGRRIAQAGCQDLAVVLVEISFHKPAKFDHIDLSWKRSVIEVMPATELEQQLDASVGALLDDLLRAPSSERYQ